MQGNDPAFEARRCCFARKAKADLYRKSLPDDLSQGGGDFVSGVSRARTGTSWVRSRWPWPRPPRRGVRLCGCRRTERRREPSRGVRRRRWAQHDNDDCDVVPVLGLRLGGQFSSTREHDRMENGTPLLRQDGRRLESPDEWVDAEREFPDDLGDRQDALDPRACVVEIE